jgi:hypothetical protein
VWDRSPFVANVKYSAVLVDPGRFTLIVTSNHSIEQCISSPAEREAVRRRFKEMEPTEENKEAGLAHRLNRAILRA